MQRSVEVFRTTVESQEDINCLSFYAGFLTLRGLKQETVTDSMNVNAAYEIKLVPTRNVPESPKLVEKN